MAQAETKQAKQASGGSRFIDAIRRRPTMFVVTLIVVAAAVAIPLSLSHAGEYEASATLLVDVPRQSAPVGERRVATSADLLRLRAVATRAARELGTTPSEVSERVEIRAADPSDVIHIDATAQSAEDATATANAYARAYLSFGTVTSPAALEPPDASLVQQAVEADDASPGVLALDVGIGLLAGLLAALLLIALREGLDRRVRTIEELEELYELPLLARIPRSRSLSKKSGSAAAIENTLGFSEEAEAFRTLRTNLRYFNVDEPVRSLLLASPLPGDGKSTVARHLAITMASMGDSVCLVDADLRKQAVGPAPPSDGLSLVLAGFELDDALTEVPVSFDPISDESRTLFQLPSGPLPPNPAELLESARMRWLIGELERRFDVVIIDSPALVTVSDALAVVPEVTGVLIVGGVQQTVRQAALDLRKQIDLLGGRALGVVANFSSRSPSYYHGRYYDQPGRRERSAA